MSVVQKAMESQYSFVEEPGGSTTVTITKGGDFPYRIKSNGGPVYRLSQAFSSRAWVKPTYKKVGDFLSFDLALERIVARHNKACGHMTDWQKIEVPE